MKDSFHYACMYACILLYACIYFVIFQNIMKLLKGVAAQVLKIKYSSQDLNYYPAVLNSKLVSCVL